ncbi:RHS repeat-associated core domain-containing protein [Parachlamydia acanthamoebae]|uniref:RHS repeat-associated core domain-containing protein n=1 Tax=Parachlamydia acanthamoebae TaxID=83552 RepID=UPI0009AE7775|nr:RHS repeat-associated core domain-containing protein [Parachlamydia acanthamoebae]
MRSFQYFLVTFILLFSALMAEEEDLLLEPSEEIARTPRSKEKNDIRISFANLLGIPNGIVEGMVNVVTGDFVQHDIDLVLPSSTPLTLERTYASSFGSHGSLSVGWNFNHYKVLHLYPIQKDRFEALLNEGMGAIAKFEGYKPIPAKSNISPESLKLGATNCGKGEISGKTNPNNISLHNHTGSGRGHLSILEGSGMRHHFTHLSFKDNDNFYIYQSHHPNGNFFDYYYKKKQVNACSLYDSKGNYVSHYEIYMNSTNKEKTIEIFSSDKRKVSYSLKKINHQWLLFDVESTDVPSIKYVYGDFCEYPHLVKKILPDSRYVQISYWLKNEACGGTEIDIKDPRHHTVKCIMQPVGLTSDPIQTYSFEYKLKGQGEGGETIVRDVQGNKTSYHYNTSQRLTKIEYCGRLAKGAHRRDNFYWGGENNTNLMIHAITDQNNGVQLLHHFTYDAYGNPLTETIEGNLSGQNMCNPMVGNDQKVAKTGCESHVKICDYELQTSYNHKVCEREGIKKTKYSYYKGKDQVATKFIYDGNNIKERHFYQYNDQGMLTREVTDDGSQTNELNRTNVRQCLIHEISPVKEGLTYLPEEEKFSCVDANGQNACFKRVVNHYDKHGRLIAQDHFETDRSPSPRYRLHWTYDAHGNVIEQVNAAGETIYRTFDANDNVLSERGSHLPYRKNFSYDFMNRLTSVETIDEADISYKLFYEYDKRSNRTASIDHYGNKTCYEYDAFNRLVKTIYPPLPRDNGEIFAPTEEFEYSALGYVTKTRNGNEDLTIQQNTIRGQPYYINYPDGSIERMTYILDGNLKEKTEKNGMRTVYTYDYKDRALTSESFSPEGECLGKHSYEYSAFHLLKETDAKGHVTTYEYNPQGQLTGAIKEGSAVYYTYDPLGRKETIKTFFGHGENDYTLDVFAYDLHDYVIEARQEDAFKNVLRKQTFVYDADGNQVETSTYSDAGVSTVKTTYNCHKQPTSVTDSEGNVTRVTYRYDYVDVYGLTVPYSEITDPKGNVTVSIYNTHNNISTLQIKNAFGQIIQQREFFYDGVGQLIETREKVFKQNAFDREVITKWTYNSIGDVASCIEAVGTPEQKSTFHAFNNYSQKVSTTKPDGNLIYFTYDAKGRLSAIASADQTLSYAYTYDLNDNPIIVQDFVNNCQNVRSYDRCDRLVEEKLGNGLSMRYAYDRQGRIHSSTLPDDSHVVYTYNAIDLTEVKRLNLSGEELYSQTYKYDQAGNVVQKGLPFNLGKTTYTYDLLGRHKSIHSPHFSETDVMYDDVGNLLKQTYTDPLGSLPCQYSYDDLYQLNSESSQASHSYQYDSLYNRLMKDEECFDFNSLNQLLGDRDGTYYYDPNGNLTERHDQKYAYDVWDRLLSVTVGNTRFNYTYDDLSRRLSKSKALWDPLTNAWIVQDAEYYLYQGYNEVGVCDKDRRLIEFRTLGRGQGGEIGAAIAFEIQGQVYIPVTNFIGNVQVLLSTAGEPVDVYRYTAFGEETISDSAGNNKEPTSAWRFCSKRCDSETGFIYYGRRYYDPQTARWITADPLGYEAGANLYAYANNNPLINIDLYGLDAGLVDDQDQISHQENAEAKADGQDSNIIYESVAGIANGYADPGGSLDKLFRYAGEVFQAVCNRDFTGIREKLSQKSLGWVCGTICEVFTVGLMLISNPKGMQAVVTMIRCGITHAKQAFRKIVSVATLSIVDRARSAIKNQAKLLPIRKEAKVALKEEFKLITKKILKNKSIQKLKEKFPFIFEKDPLTGSGIINHNPFNPQTDSRNPNTSENVKQYDGIGLGEDSHSDNAAEGNIHTFYDSIFDFGM